MLRLLVDFWRWWLSRLGVHLKSNARPATPSRVGRSDKMSDPSSNGTVIAGRGRICGPVDFTSSHRYRAFVELG